MIYYRISAADPSPSKASFLPASLARKTKVHLRLQKVLCAGLSHIKDTTIPPLSPTPGRNLRLPSLHNSPFYGSNRAPERALGRFKRRDPTPFLGLDLNKSQPQRREPKITLQRQRKIRLRKASDKVRTACVSVEKFYRRDVAAMSPVPRVTEEGLPQIRIKESIMRVSSNEGSELMQQHSWDLRWRRARVEFLPSKKRLQMKGKRRSAHRRQSPLAESTKPDAKSRNGRTIVVDEDSENECETTAPSTSPRKLPRRIHINLPMADTRHRNESMDCTAYELFGKNRRAAH